MRVFPRIERWCLTALVLACGLAPAPVAHAQPDEEDPAPSRRDRDRFDRSRPFARGGFRGLTPEEAKEAQDLLDQGKALQARGKDAAALGKYKRVTKRFPRSKAAPDAYFAMAQIYLADENYTRAFEAIDAIVRAYPDFGRFNELISMEYDIAYKMVKGDPKKFLGVLPGFTNRERGMQFFERLIFNAPYSDYAPLALMNVADALLDRGEMEAAIFTLDRLITNYPNSIVTSDGQLRLAQTHEKLVDGPLYDQSATRSAIENYEDFLILHPGDPQVAEAEAGLARAKQMLATSRLKIADFYYFKRSRYQAAKVFYNEAITIAPRSEIAQTAQQRIAEVEVDEARADARKAELAARGGGGGIFGWFRRTKEVEPIEPIEPGATPPAAGGTVTPSPGSNVQATP